MTKKYFEDLDVINKVFKEEEEESLPKPDMNKPVFKLYPKAAENVKAGKCATCGKEIKAKDFKDDLSKKEYGISGMCQKCQDDIFG